MMDYEARKVMLQARRQRDVEIRDQLRRDLEEEYGIPATHPKAELLWTMAWEDGHSAGYQEVGIYYEKYVSLVK